MTTRRVLGYDWFKLVVALTLALLLLVFGLRAGAESVAQAPAVPATSVPTAAAPTAAPTTPPTAEPTVASTSVPTVEPTAAATVEPTSAPTLAPSASGGQTGPIAAPALDPPAGGSLAAGSVTLEGRGTAGSQVEVILDGAVVGTAAVGPDGRWSLPVDLAVGDRVIVLRALDSTGAAVAESPAATVAVGPPSAGGAASAGDTPAASASPAITFPADGAQVPAGPLTLKGTGAPGAQLEVLDSDKLLGTVTAAADGSWELPITSGDGTAAYSVRPVGGQEVSAKPIRVTIGAGQQSGGAALAVGGKAWVTREQGRSLRLRAGGGLSSRVVALLPVGSEVTLLAGPQPGDGYSWWRVRTLGGREGWVAGEELRPQPD